jgi:hypothetical protein
MDKWIGLALIIIPAADMADRYRRGGTYRELKKMRDIGVVRVILRDTQRFYEPMWYHRVLPAIGAVLLIGSLL